MVGGFKDRLYLLRQEKGWSQSHLARLVWGTLTDARGYEVAKNRDRVSQYEKGGAVPTRENLEALAAALGVPVAELAPDLVRANPSMLPPGEKPGASKGQWNLVSLSGGRVQLQINQVVMMETAVKIMGLLQADKGDRVFAAET